VTLQIAIKWQKLFIPMGIDLYRSYVSLPSAALTIAMSMVKGQQNEIFLPSEDVYNVVRPGMLGGMTDFELNSSVVFT